MASVLYRLGLWTYRRRARVVVGWLLALALAGGAGLALNQGTDNTFSIPGTESGEALTSLSHTFPQVSGTSAHLVVAVPEGADVTDAPVRAAVGEFLSTAQEAPQVVAVTDPYDTQVGGLVSPDGQALQVSIQLDGQATTVEQASKDALTAARDDLAAALPEGSQVALGGDLFTQNVPAVGAVEALGVLVALVVLLVTFASFVAAGMPLLTGLVGVGVTMAGIIAATRFATISSTTPLLALMLGLAVGIDYALFIISRHQGQLRDGMDPEESVARSVATAGSAVVFAGLTVMIALVGLAIAQIPFLTVMGVAAAIAVGLAVLVSLTLTPALLAFAGIRLLPRRMRPGAPRGQDAPDEQSAMRESGNGVHHNRFFDGWVRGATRWPVVTILLVVVGLGALALPALSLRLALPDAGSQPAGTPAREAYELTAEHFGPGYNGPLIVTATIVGSTDPLGLMADLREQIEAMPGVAAVPLATPNQDATVGIVQVIPTGGPDSDETADLVTALRAQREHFAQADGVDIAVTGLTAVQIDISARLGQALLPFALFVVGLSFVLLTMVFRSLWVPLTATLGYLLSVAAAFGAVSLVFEHQVGAGLLGLDHSQPVLSFMPIVVMGVLFGLAMDYEVFLVSRMREEYVHRGGARRAVRVGFLSSAKVVTAAALIMFSVFAAFVPGEDPNIKPIALGLAVGVFIDAFVVRMTLVPALLHLLGDRAWRMPAWLERALPRFDVEGEGLEAELALADWPATPRPTAIAADGLGLVAPDGTDLVRDIGVLVPEGGTLVVAGPPASGRTALLLLLAGRAHPTSGRLKVAGLAAPVRARDIRHRVGYVALTRSTDPVGDLVAALGERPEVLVVDDLDAIVDPDARAGLVRVLDAARSKNPSLTTVFSALPGADLVGFVPADHQTVRTDAPLPTKAL